MSILDSAENYIAPDVCSEFLFSKNQCYSRYDIEKVKVKLVELSNYLLGPSRLQLKYATKSECEELTFLVTNVITELGHFANELGKSHRQKDYNFSCNICGEIILANKENLWELFQNHEHIEELYHKFLSAEISPNQNSTHRYSSERTFEDTLNKSVEKIEVDNFKFNFIPLYHKSIHSILYPNEVLKLLGLYAKVNYPTIIATGPSRLTCLLCPCYLECSSREAASIVLKKHLVESCILHKTENSGNMNAVYNFHQVWLGKETNIQAHQVYFIPDKGTVLKCILCSLYIDDNNVEKHIYEDVHKMNIFKNYNNKTNTYYLLDVQVKVYGGIPQHINIQTNSSLIINGNNHKTVEVRNETSSGVMSVNNVTQPNVIGPLLGHLNNIPPGLMPYILLNHYHYFMKYGNIVKCLCCPLYYTVMNNATPYNCLQYTVYSGETILSPTIVELFKNKQTVIMQAEKLLNQSKEMSNHLESTMKCCRIMKNKFVAVFEKCKVYPFGSRMSGLGNQNSDLDMFLDIGGMYYGSSKQDSDSQKQIVEKIHSILIKDKEEFQHVICKSTARTPIVQCYFRKFDINCDLSFRNGLSVENTKFLKLCFELQPVSQPFILVLKLWSHSNGLSKEITTYALAMIAIFYLQKQGYLLSVNKLQQINQRNDCRISGWEIIEYTKSVAEMRQYISPYPHDLVELLKNFFLFYCKFDYSDNVICPLLGQCVRKLQFNGSGTYLPPQMNTYCAQLQSKEPEHFRNAECLCVQDPFDLSHNLTKAVSEKNLNQFKVLCEMSYKLLALL